MKNYQLILFLLILILSGACKKSLNDNQAIKSDVERFLEKSEDNNISDTLRIQYLDSAYSDLLNSGNDSLSRTYLKRTASDFYMLNDYKKAIAVSDKYYNFSAEAKDTAQMAKALYLEGISYYELSNNDSAFFSYKEAERLFSGLNDYENLAAIILYKAHIYYNIGDYVLCESEAIKALRLLREQKRTIEIYQCYSLIGTALDGQNNNEEAIKYFQLALDELENFKDEGYTEDEIEDYRASCYNNMGLVYVKMKRYDEAISMYTEALEYRGMKSAKPFLYARLINNLASAKLKKGDFTDLPDLFIKALHIRDSLDNKSDMIASRYNLGQYYVARKDTAKAITYLSMAYNGAKAMHNSTDILKSLRLLADVDVKNSLHFSEEYIRVNDSLQEKGKADRNRFARIAYETDRLETEKEELAKKNTFIIGVSVVVLLFVAAIFMIYYLNSRNKKLMLIQEQQRANEEIYQLMFEQQSKIDSARADEKTRIAMELHDGILNNIYAVRLNLEFSNRKSDEESVLKRKGFIKELQQVEGEIRAVSHDLSRNVIFEQNQNFDSILAYMVTSQKNTVGTEFEAHVDATIDWETIPNTTKINIYRIIQESLQNINKYANARHATVGIIKDDKIVKITITDDGDGFDTAKTAGGIGLKNFKKRAEALSGELAIESAPGHGTTVMVQFPL
ncbi:tetratricopeptide repeat protein [Flavobacterium zepuense]|uniref:histidine kinase n=1 Tax=Flavobacterium zepuense TaxID=2593302 RepID=A0A552V4J9_9FLAO|nr:sensor histidine kinase [Flavobacterium zepuense]TRW25377.1 tetratricopeptide repeat protein [Flavobacterium zepuense]